MSFPVCLQHDAMECGAACLKIVAEHYGRNYSLETLGEYLCLDSDGVSMLAMSKAAERIGMHTIGGRLSFENLAKEAPLPCIVHWNQNHFVVVYKIKHGKVHVSDPAKGLVDYSYDEFKEHWISDATKGEYKGILLLLEPTNTFYGNAGDDIEKKSRVKFLGGYFARYKRSFAKLSLALLAGSVIQLSFPFLTQAIVDKGIKNSDIGLIWLILLAELMLLFSATAIDFVRRRILLYVSTKINITLVSDFFVKLMKLPMKFFDIKQMGDLIQRIEDHYRVESFLTSQSLNLLFSLLSVIVFGAVLLVYDVKIFLIFVAGSIVYGAWLLLFLKRRRMIDYELFEQQAENRNTVYQLVNGMQEIKLHGCEQRKRWQWEQIQNKLFKVNKKSLSLQQSQEAGGVCINELKNILITVIAATSVIGGDLTLGMMLAIQYIIGQLSGPVDDLMDFVYDWQDVAISLDRMSEIQSLKNEETEQRSTTFIENGTIEISHLSFIYNLIRSGYAIDDVTLAIPQGKVTAIVGASGSGKTTLIKILLGYYSPNKGIVSIGKTNLENINLKWWRSQCGVVMQEGYIFSDTIARNIAVSSDEIDEERMHEAAHIAHIDEYIENLPMRYNTMIGQDGQGLSKGQSQRILIARAVYRNPQFLFFDEATNSLDAKNEREITESLEQFYKDKTVVVVAHRLSTVKNADNIIVLDNGRVAEQGTHEELTKLKGKYFELVRNQLELGV